jgi:proline dehydrogenase
MGATPFRMSSTASIPQVTTQNLKEFDELIFFTVDTMPVATADRKGTPSSQKKATIDFSDPRLSFKIKTFGELLRGKFVFTACQIQPLVNHSERLIKLSYKILGLHATNFVLQSTFFGHFCAGEDEESVRPTVKRLENSGVGSILDYAAEADVEEDKEKEVKPTSAAANSSSTSSSSRSKLQGRVYDYKNEEMCEIHLKTFTKAINSVKNVSPTGFAAIKCTALGNPELLKRVSSTLVEIRKLFHAIDKENTGFVTKEQFIETFSNKVEGHDISQYFENWDKDGDGRVDYIEWTNGLKIEELHFLAAHSTVRSEKLSKAVLNEEERELLKKMKERVHSLAQLAKDLGVRLMIDAEHTYFQPAIDNITNELSKKYNKSGTFPAIFSTYQMYLKDSYHRLITDMDRARKGHYKFAAKLVRGAYMVLERQHALDNGLPDPINDNIGITHDNYNLALTEAISRISKGDDIEIMIASHNQQSVELAVKTMTENNLSPSAGVYFGQLMGMSDHLTFALGSHGYKAYKYVPYGKVQEVMPYLIRRAQENSSALSGAKTELHMIRQELTRRLT